MSTILIILKKRKINFGAKLRNLNQKVKRQKFKGKNSKYDIPDNDSVYPGVKITKRKTLNQFYSPISFVLNNDTISYLSGYPKVLLDLALLNDSVFRYTEETAIKTYIYLNHMQNQKYTFSEINSIKILKRDTSFLDNNKYHKEQDTLIINYIIDISVDSASHSDQLISSK